MLARAWHDGPVSADPPVSPSTPPAGDPPTVTGGWPPAPGHPPAADRRRRRWLLVACATVWSLLLVGLAVGSARQDTPTVREQHGIDEARPVADRAAVDLVTAVGDAGVVVLGAERISGSCRITPIRPGAELTRVLTAYTDAGSGPALLDRIAQRLPASYSARTRHGDTGVSRLGADAGDFVAVRGELIRPGVVELRISTGCRPAESGAASTAGPAGDGDDEPARLLARLGATDVQAEAPVAVPCPAGGWLRSWVAAGTGPADQVAEALAAEVRAGVSVVADTSPLYAYRDGDAGTVVEADGDQILVARTRSGCAS